MGRPSEYDAAVSLRAWAQEAEAAAGIAKALAGTAFVPEQLRRYTNPDAPPAKRVLDYDGTVQTVTAVLLAGQELGFGPMASLRSITIIKGTVALYALAARALLLHAGFEIIVKESTTQRAVVVGRRTGGEWQTSTWDLDRAKTARLFPGSEFSNWRTQTKAMLVARATAEVSRWIAADALLGLPVMVEELEENADGQVPALEVGNAATDQSPEPAPKVTRRRTPPARVALPAAGLPPPPEPPPAPAPQEPVATVRPRLTPQQRTRILASLRDIGVTERAESLALLSAWANRRDEAGEPVQLTSTNELTPEEASVIIDRLDSLLTARAADRGEDQPPEEPPDAEPD